MNKPRPFPGVWEWNRLYNLKRSVWCLPRSIPNPLSETSRTMCSFWRREEIRIKGVRVGERYLMVLLIKLNIKLLIYGLMAASLGKAKTGFIKTLFVMVKEFRGRI